MSMSKCEKCKHKLNENFFACDVCIREPSLKDRYEPLTNADRIRAMTDEELALEFMTWRMETEAKHHGVESNYPNTQAAILEWLQQPAEE